MRSTTLQALSFENSEKKEITKENERDRDSSFPFRSLSLFVL